MKKGKRMGRINSMQTSSSHMGATDKIIRFDLTKWLKSIDIRRDFVVIKIDMEGTEFHLIPKLIESGG